MAGELIKAGDVLTIGQRVEFFVGDEDEKYTSRIEDITENYLVVAMPMTRRRVPVIPPKEAKLYALAVGEQCRYRFLSVWKGYKMQDGRIPVWLIAKPQEAERFQNREFVRINVSQKVRVSLIDSEGRIEEPIQTRTVDLSGTGICFVMPKPVEAGLQAGLFIYDIPGVGNVDVMSRVARCTAVEDGAGGVSYHVGAGFEHLSRPIMNKLIRYLFAVQRRDIAKGIHL